MAIKTFQQRFILLLVRRRGFFWRGLLCWLIGCVVLFNQDVSNFDPRFQLRGNQPVSRQIVVIRITLADLMRQNPFDHFGPANEAADVTDIYYWDPSLWRRLISQILEHQPYSVGVSFYFPESMSRAGLTQKDFELYQDPRIFWASIGSQNDRYPLPMFATFDQSNVGSIDFLRDDDGTIRKYTSDLFTPQLAERVAGQMIHSYSTRLINYRGIQNLFTEYSLSSILENRIPEKALRNKIILIGPETTRGTQYLTPLGPSPRTDILGQLVDNELGDRWVRRWPLEAYAAVLFVLLLISLFVLNQYPQSVALFLLIWLATLFTALSIWIFDTWYFWLPMAAPVIQILATYIIFIGYQANTIERKHWQLKQEQKNLMELEVLKNNFVSLISHDLKTPIAKIQAILDRLRLENLPPEISKDLLTMHQSSDELNRYIQSILRVLRVESRDFRLHPEVGDINESIEQALEQLHPLAREKNITVHTQLEPMFSIEADFTLIREVLVNLIENAIKYTPANGQVSIRSAELDHEVQVEVLDNGSGIPADELSSVWGKFVRGRDQDHKTRGTGLGLYLVKFFIELHGGKVGIDSQIDKGTRVYFTLPVEMK